MRADRLLSILMLLQTKGRMTAHDLADQLEVSERTIYRDLEALGMAGVPVYTERGPGGGCSLIDGYQTKLTGLTETEVRALFLLNMVSPLADLGLGKALEDARLKLTASLPSTARESAELVQQRFHLDAAWWYHDSHASSYLQTIQEAVWQDRNLCLVYREDEGGWSEQVVEPYGLVAKAGIWYLVALCQGVHSVYRVSRIQDALMLEAQFVRLADFDLASYWADYCTQTEAAHPRYAVPLRLAPEETQMLPELLSEWGYMLVESEEPMDVDAQIMPFPGSQQKKASFPHIPLPREMADQQPADQSQARELLVLNHAGQWLPLSSQRQQKKRILPVQKKRHLFINGNRPSQKKTNGTLKKRHYDLRAGQANKKKSASGYIKNQPLKKKPFEFSKKTDFSHDIKKTNLYHLQPCSLAFSA